VRAFPAFRIREIATRERNNARHFIERKSPPARPFGRMLADVIRGHRKIRHAVAHEFDGVIETSSLFEKSHKRCDILAGNSGRNGSPLAPPWPVGNLHHCDPWPDTAASVAPRRASAAWRRTNWCESLATNQSAGTRSLARPSLDAKCRCGR